jgi:hypothetical protein
MIFPKIIGKNFFFLENTNSTFSQINLGIIIKAISSNKKILYIDSKNKSKKIISFFEKLCLNKEFNLNFKMNNFDIYSINKNNINVSILPKVEYSNLPLSKIFSNLKKYDYIIFEELDFEIIPKEIFIEFLKMKNEKTNIIISTNSENIYENLIDEFDKKYLFFNQSQNSLISNRNVKYKYSKEFEINYLISLGNLFSNLIDNKNSLFFNFFDNSDYESEKHFLFVLKKIMSSNSNLFSIFEYIYCIKNEKNELEIENTLKLLLTILNKNDKEIIISNFTEFEILKNYLNPILEKLENSKNKIDIYGYDFSKKIFDKSSKVTKIIKIEDFLKENELNKQ